MSLPMLTHKGWVGICPVYFGGLDGPMPLVVERHPIFTPLHDFSVAMFQAIGWMKSMMDPDFEMAFPLRVTGEIEPRDPPHVEE